MICRNCKKEIDDKNIFCPYCGAQVRVISYDKSLYKSAKKAIKEIRTLGILESIYLVFAIIISILISFSNEKTEIGIAFSSIIIDLLFAIPMLVLFISVLTRYKAVKYHSSINILWLTLAYPVLFGLDILINVLFFINAYVGTDAFYIALTVIDCISLVLFIVFSFVLAWQIKETLHQ